MLIVFCGYEQDFDFLGSLLGLKHSLGTLLSTEHHQHSHHLLQHMHLGQAIEKESLGKSQYLAIHLLYMDR